MARIKTKKSLENKIKKGITLYGVFPFSTLYSSERTVFTFDIHSENVIFGTKTTIGLDIYTSDLMTELLDYLNPNEYLIKIESMATIPVNSLIPTKAFLRSRENNDKYEIFSGFDNSIYMALQNSNINYEYGAVFDSFQEANEYCTYAKTIVNLYDKRKLNGIINIHNSLTEYLKSR